VVAGITICVFDFGNNFTPSLAAALFSRLRLHTHVTAHDGCSPRRPRCDYDGACGTKRSGVPHHPGDDDALKAMCAALLPLLPLLLLAAAASAAAAARTWRPGGCQHAEQQDRRTYGHHHQLFERGGPGGGPPQLPPLLAGAPPQLQACVLARILGSDGGASLPLDRLVASCRPAGAGQRGAAPGRGRPASRQLSGAPSTPSSGGEGGGGGSAPPAAPPGVALQAWLEQRRQRWQESQQDAAERQRELQLQRRQQAGGAGGGRRTAPAALSPVCVRCRRPSHGHQAWGSMMVPAAPSPSPSPAPPLHHRRQ
jgi:hypothetical protein